MKVNEKIRMLREINNFTQEEMAHKLHLSTNGYANIERGETKVHLARLEEIAQIFKIDVTELLSVGEKNLAIYDNSTHHGINIIGGEISDKSLIFEISKLQMEIQHRDELLQHKDEIIQQKNREIDTLNQHKEEVINQKNQEIETLKILVDVLKGKN